MHALERGTTNQVPYAPIALELVTTTKQDRPSSSIRTTRLESLYPDYFLPGFPISGISYADYTAIGLRIIQNWFA